jgi:hypothetical protein
MAFTDLDKLAPALVGLQADLMPVAKTADNPFFKSSYAPLTEVMKSVQPLLAKHKLAVSQWVTYLDGGQSALRTILIHESGQTIEDVQPLLLSKQDPQGQGSAITYARRYGVMAVLGIVADEDDDGNAASHPRGASSNAPTNASSSKPASEKQIGLIKSLAKRKGKDEAWIAQVILATNSSAHASEAIDKLDALSDFHDDGIDQTPLTERTYR